MSVAAATAIWPVIASGQTIDSGDTAWMLTSTALVLFMTLPGLALFYAGLVQRRNALSVLMQCFAIACVMSILWVVCGYSLAFGESSMGGLIGNLSLAWLSGVSFDTPSSVLPNIPESVFVMFQMTFAIITPALIVGAFAERMRFSAMLIFTSLWLLVVYAPVAHWIWGGGWLSAMGFRDFAGGAVVHVTAGSAALVAALVMGNRRGFPETPMPPHNLTMTITGACMLWVGWFGFNAGSAGAANGAAGMAMLVTHISAACASLTWMGAEWIKFGKPSVLGIATGMVAGLATITPASGFVGPIGGLIIGVAAGGGCFVATQFMKRVLKIDDSLDVFPVHGVGGMIGLLLTAVFSAAAFGGVGLDEGGIGGQFVTQIIGIVATLAWCGGATFVLLKVIDMIVPLRVSAEEETEGLDLVLHEESGYNL
ncbi:MAG: ammonium transporter [Gammaproteobacteria bacterium]|nr:ammonium transporter [Gammaproteobacteria bacterium]